MFFSFRVPKYSQKYFESIKGQKIGEGSEKLCFIKLTDPARCLKVSCKDKCKQILREIKYFNSLKLEQRNVSFLPKFFCVFETKEFIGYEQECFVERQKGGIYDKVETLWCYINNSKISEEEIKKELESIKTEMISKNVICCDLHGGNILKVRLGDTSKFVVVDGFGAPEFFPICKYIRCLGRMKIERQWRKFIRRISNDFKRR